MPNDRRQSGYVAECAEGIIAIRGEYMDITKLRYYESMRAMSKEEMDAMAQKNAMRAQNVGMDRLYERGQLMNNCWRDELAKASIEPIKQKIKWAKFVSWLDSWF